MATAVVGGSQATVTAVGPGTAVATVTATDVGGSNTSATQRFTVTVSAANEPPEVVGVLAAVTLEVGEGSVAVELSGAFRDPDGDVLTYGAVSSARAVAAVSVSGSYGDGDGVVARDGGGHGDGDGRWRFEHVGDADVHGDGAGSERAAGAGGGFWRR